MLSFSGWGARATLLGAALCAASGATSCASGTASGLPERVLADMDHGYAPSLAVLGDFMFVAQYEGADGARLTLLRAPLSGGDAERTVVGAGYGPLLSPNGHQIGLAYASSAADRRVHFARLDDRGKPIPSSDRPLDLAGSEHLLQGLSWNERSHEWALVFEELLDNRWHLHLARVNVGGEVVTDQDLGETCSGAPSDAAWDGLRYVVLKTCVVPDSSSNSPVYVDELQMWTSDSTTPSPAVLDRGVAGRPRIALSPRGALVMVPAGRRIDAKAVEVRTIELVSGQWSAPTTIPTAPYDLAAFDAAGSSAGVAVVLAEYVPGGKNVTLLRLTDRGELIDTKSLGRFEDFNASFDVGWARGRVVVVHTQGDTNAAHELVSVEP